MSDSHIDDVSGVATTGHEWDGIRELNNPLPRWWVWTFYITIAWALAYAVAYPAWPMLTGATKGLLGYSSRSDVHTELSEAAAARGDTLAAIGKKTVTEILADENLRQFAISAGAAAFKVNCIQCHGTGAAGSPGYPNLNDDDWLWGGKPEEIYTTITHGIRFASDDETRMSEMPPFAEGLEPQQIKSVAAYVAHLGAKDGSATADKDAAELFAANCAACHGEQGVGNREVGGPNLTDAIWLYGSTEEDIARQIRAPRHGVMPAWSQRLGDTTVKELAVFVHSLGGGE